MKTEKPLFAAIALSVGLLSVTTANATLINNGAMIYDTDLNINWLADANLAASNTFGVSGIYANGAMNWYTAQNWIGAMNTANYLGYHDWRLPATLQPDASCGYNYGYSFGYNCTGSEMGHLFYNELGGTAGNPILASSDPDLALFQNVQYFSYWSGTGFAPPDTGYAWFFSTYYGAQYGYGKGNLLFAWAVRPGQVAAVPEPETGALLLAGLGMLGFVARRRRLDIR